LYNKVYIIVTRNIFHAVKHILYWQDIPGKLENIAWKPFFCIPKTANSIKEDKMGKMLLRSKIANLLIIGLLAVILLSGHTAFAQSGLIKLADNVYSYAGVQQMSAQNSFGANAAVIIGADGILVVDTLVSAKEAQRLIRDIRAISDKPIKYVVNTHIHLDHSFGNFEFQKLGATIIAHSSERETARKLGNDALANAKAFGMTDKDLEGTIITYPTLSFNDRMEIDLGGQFIELIHPGPSHTAGSIMVYLPDKKILFTGDILFTGYHPFVAEGNIPDWLSALDYIMHMDATVIIPGHGPVSTKKDVEDMKKYLTLFDEKAKELCAQSNDVKYIVAELKKVLPERPEGEGLIYGNILYKYLKSN
jgi:cyclase